MYQVIHKGAVWTFCWYPALYFLPGLFQYLKDSILSSRNKAECILKLSEKGANQLLVNEDFYFTALFQAARRRQHRSRMHSPLKASEDQQWVNHFSYGIYPFATMVQPMTERLTLGIQEPSAMKFFIISIVIPCLSAEKHFLIMIN